MLVGHCFLVATLCRCYSTAFRYCLVLLTQILPSCPNAPAFPVRCTLPALSRGEEGWPRECRLAAGESLASMPYEPSAPDPSLIPCPHCGRRFNEKAAQRHIEACARTVHKPKFLKAGTGGAGRGAPQLFKQVPGHR